jgi:hypothetical protein
MKKLFLSAVGVFALSLFLNLEEEKVSYSQSALADGTCCPESGSKCVFKALDGAVGHMSDYYYKKTGSCKTNPAIQ